MTDQDAEGVSPVLDVDVGLPGMVVTASEGESWDDIKTAKKIPRGDRPMLVPLVRVINGIVQKGGSPRIGTITKNKQKN